MGADLGRVVCDLGRMRDEPVGQLAERAANRWNRKSAPKKLQRAPRTAVPVVLSGA